MTEPRSEPTDAGKPVAEQTDSTAVQTSPLDQTPAQIEDTENYIEAYHAVAEWIRFADAKAGVVLTVGGALAGLLIPSIAPILREDPGNHLVEMWQPTVLTLFALFILFLLLSGVVAFLCITPFRHRGRHPALDDCKHFHPAAIAHAYGINEVQRFIQDCDDGGTSGFREEVVAALLFDSHISNVKYRRVTRSIQLFAVSAFFAFLYLLAIQL
ncbi:MAG: hypothetical protein H8E66_13800 [Planctomycetes bacterium]|nr:hypothetical protein [Planctomycetota bacterium]